MRKSDMVRIVGNLVDAARELDGEHQEGWTEIVEEGQEFLNFIKNIK